MAWDQTRGDEDLNSYAIWEQADLQNNPRLQIDGLIRLAAYVQLNAETSVPELLKFIADSGDTYAIAPHEADLLLTEEERGTKEKLRAIISVPLNEARNPRWTVLEFAAPFIAPRKKPDPRNAKAIPPPEDRNGGVIIGIVDDGIGFLNQRFQDAAGGTRFRKVLVDTTGLKPGAVPRELDTAEIDGMISSGRTEEDIYREVNDSVFAPDEHWPSAHHVGHGTAVLDIAANPSMLLDPAMRGPNPDPDAIKAVPLLAYQLKPSAIAETSGRRLYPAMIVALRWVMAEALRGAGSKQTLIVNLSLGALAGPADDTSEMEQAFRLICDDYARLSLGGTMRIAASYGNARRARLVAKKALKKGETLVLDWRILPDDGTASFLELRVEKGAGSATGIKVEPSDDPASSLSLTKFPPLGLLYQYFNATGRIAELSRLKEPNFDALLLAVAPTVRDDSRPRSQSGCWRVTLTNHSAGELVVSAKVQRDDTPAGYRRQGRQSWLDCDDPLRWDWDARDYSAPAPASPVRRAGTQVSYAGTQDARVYLVAAGRPDPDLPGELRPSPYSGEADPTLAARAYPSVIALADEGAALAGRRGAGIRSGSGARYSGTSVSAPVVTRALAMEALGLVMTEPVTPGGERHDPAELAALTTAAPTPAADVRAGFGRVAG